MILKNILELKKSINKHRKDLYRISKDKRLSDPEVLNLSRQLDGEIETMQKLMKQIR
ncbi:aspartyl-phosphate phosphatase Spo0E family protein [Metabacillus rhizosphaerae]|uniref:aspartyl-phosphate phosphatase Spo0E family protein n=1 Tax=Metabacillus rhizosphaerae TaxID=3117747 RepID=UPI0039B777F5